MEIACWICAEALPVWSVAKAVEPVTAMPSVATPAAASFVKAFIVQLSFLFDLITRARQKNSPNTETMRSAIHSLLV
jgi:hypothetical protein